MSIWCDRTPEQEDAAIRLRRAISERDEFQAGLSVALSELTAIREALCSPETDGRCTLASVVAKVVADRDVAISARDQSTTTTRRRRNEQADGCLGGIRRREVSKWQCSEEQARVALDGIDRYVAKMLPVGPLLYHLRSAITQAIGPEVELLRGELGNQPLPKGRGFLK